MTTQLNKVFDRNGMKQECMSSYLRPENLSHVHLEACSKYKKIFETEEHRLPSPSATTVNFDRHGEF